MIKQVEIQTFCDDQGEVVFEADCVADEFSKISGNQKMSLILIVTLEGCLRGNCQACGRSFELSAGQALIFFNPKGSLRLERDCSGHVKSVLLRVDPALLGCCGGGSEPMMPGLLPGWMQKMEASRSLLPIILSPLMGVIGRQILDCPLASPVRDIYLNGKALEMLACCLTSLEMGQRSRHGCSCRLREEEREKIRLAREILLRDLEAPPRLEQLAARVGLNATKLKRGFRHLFGTSVFDCFRNYRLETARRILEQDQVSVTEAAMTVGYSNVGHFCAAFKKQFGVSPGHWLRSPSTAISSEALGF
ncbi:helix-turn-helix transcriptional activator, AraC family [Syntrophotalea carbinolica DSM 2380]|uniref:Helix-turn-helix transcriptional activator, AraC family n=1 Tax=Syntrophotalea carbinolica (strain DSM 2380 / NBRC 103641 / GraBd1) TaxID=338963 RepID=Q3A690_SYNC1|nr:AraC family transcriptional regulator [Syntrophotalea carbinolica]ABA88117.1 helix-turn-helix transcriptional activator, AraC family [Syntrophotalea carbinolica DSM 2380]